MLSLWRQNFGFTRSFSALSQMSSVFDFKPSDRAGKPFDLQQQKGKVLLIVNTASKCGMVGQLKDLEELHKKYKDQGLVILGFPSNSFNQEDLNNDNVESFCQLNYGVTFKMLGKIEVNGDNEDPLYSYLKKEKPGILGLKRIKWNYEKFLVGRDGKVAARYSTIVNPRNISSDIERELAKQI
ncbi:hypothetical protein EDD86DRAFT_197814 [Gorgonomyces haynaldii]|nr:hypothetical protein EDD86DRAFT_197814 [Gorgonomyces haynaldii]